MTTPKESGTGEEDSRHPRTSRFSCCGKPAGPRLRDVAKVRDLRPNRASHNLGACTAPHCRYLEAGLPSGVRVHCLGTAAPRVGATPEEGTAWAALDHHRATTLVAPDAGIRRLDRPAPRVNRSCGAALGICATGQEWAAPALPQHHRATAIRTKVLVQPHDPFDCRTRPNARFTCRSPLEHLYSTPCDH